MQSRNICESGSYKQAWCAWDGDFNQHQDIQWEPEKVIMIGSGTYGFSTNNIT